MLGPHPGCAAGCANGPRPCRGRAAADLPDRLRPYDRLDSTSCPWVGASPRLHAVARSKSLARARFDSAKTGMKRLVAGDGIKLPLDRSARPWSRSSSEVPLLLRRLRRIRRHTRRNRGRTGRMVPPKFEEERSDECSSACERALRSSSTTWWSASRTSGGHQFPSRVQGYYGVNTGNGAVMTITACDDEAGTSESSRRAAEWVRNIPGLTIAPPEISEGDIHQLLIATPPAGT